MLSWSWQMCRFNIILIIIVIIIVIIINNIITIIIIILNNLVNVQVQLEDVSRGKAELDEKNLRFGNSPSVNFYLSVFDTNILWLAALSSLYYAIMAASSLPLHHTLFTIRHSHYSPITIHLY